MKTHTILYIYAISLCIFIAPVQSYAEEKPQEDKADVSPIIEMIKKSQEKNNKPSMQSMSFGNSKDKKETPEVEPTAEGEDTDHSNKEQEKSNKGLSSQELWNKYKDQAEKNRVKKKADTANKKENTKEQKTSENNADGDNKEETTGTKITKKETPEAPSQEKEEKKKSNIEEILENYKNATKTKDGDTVNSRSFGSLD